jgi:hypothetical protein
MRLITSLLPVLLLVFPDQRRPLGGSLSLPGFRGVLVPAS